jgi:glucose-1-phosphate thymidylyltransferase
VPKQLIPVGGRSVLARVLDDIVACGIEEIAIVTSPQAGEAVRSMVASDDRLAVEPEVLIQDEPKGLAHAFATALSFVDGAPCLLYLGDCLITGGVHHVLEESAASGADTTILVAEVDDPSRFGIVELGADGSITKLVEKPTDPPTNLAVVGVYVFARGIDDVVHSVRPSWRGEYEITDVLQMIVDRGGVVRASRLRGWWIDTGTVADVLNAQALLLESLEPEHLGMIDSSEIIGSVHVAEGAVVRNSELVGPVVIDRGSVVEGSRLGPSTTVGAGSSIRNAVVKHSILMEGVSVDTAGLDRSILGPRASVVDSGRHSLLSVLAGADAVVSASDTSQSG